MSAPKPMKAKDFMVKHPNDWCPGCGDFGIIAGIQQALAKLAIPHHEVAMVGGIGCSGKAPYYVKSYGIHTLHGRLLPFATGIKLANPELTVVGVGGDGDGLGIGAGHFVNSGRRNVDLTYIFFDNEVYGLTKGQAAPTLRLGMQTKAMAMSNIQSQVNPIMLALASGFTWIGRGYSYDTKALIQLIQAAIQHPGLSFLDVVQPCPTYNNIHPKAFWSGKDGHGQPRIVPLPDDYDPVIPAGADSQAIYEKHAQVMELSYRSIDNHPVGVFLEDRNTSTYVERVQSRIPSYAETPPAKRPIANEKGRSNAILKAFFEQHRMR